MSRNRRTRPKLRPFEAEPSRCRRVRQPQSRRHGFDREITHSTRRQNALSVYGPNGFHRAFRGTASLDAKADLEIDCRYDAHDYRVVLEVTNLGPVQCQVTIASAYDGDVIAKRIRPGQSFKKQLSLKSSCGWYDLSITVDTDPGFRAAWPATSRTERTA